MPITYPHFSCFCTIQLNSDRPAAETWYHVILQGQARSGEIKSKHEGKRAFTYYKTYNKHAPMMQCGKTLWSDLVNKFLYKNSTWVAIASTKGKCHKHHEWEWDQIHWSQPSAKYRAGLLSAPASSEKPISSLTTSLAHKTQEHMCKMILLRKPPPHPTQLASSLTLDVFF